MNGQRSGVSAAAVGLIIFNGRQLETLVVKMLAAVFTQVSPGQPVDDEIERETQNERDGQDDENTSRCLPEHTVVFSKTSTLAMLSFSQR